MNRTSQPRVVLVKPNPIHHHLCLGAIYLPIKRGFHTLSPNAKRASLYNNNTKPSPDAMTPTILRLILSIEPEAFVDVGCEAESVLVPVWDGALVVASPELPVVAAMNGLVTDAL